MTITAGTRLTEELLLEELERMPAQQAAAVRVLYVADDPTSSASDLAGAVNADPVMTAQVMRLANSAYYGLSGRVRSSDFAVTLLGFATVRSLAAAFAAGALGDDAVTPRNFWEQAAASAAGAAQISSRLGVARSEAFSMGLLHDLGSALLCRIDASAFCEIEETATMPDSRQAVLLERKAFGMDHAAVAGVVLTKWRFPEELVEAIASHHDAPTVESSKMRRCLGGGHALAHLAAFEDFERYEANQLLPRFEDELRCADIDPKTAFDLSRHVRIEALGIASSLTG